MKVRTIREHGNGYGDSYLKKAKAEYDVPDRIAKNLIHDGIVEEIKAKPAKSD